MWAPDSPSLWGFPRVRMHPLLRGDVLFDQTIKAGSASKVPPSPCPAHRASPFKGHVLSVGGGEGSGFLNTPHEKNDPTSGTCLILPSKSPIKDSFQSYPTGKLISTSRRQTCKAHVSATASVTTKYRGEFYEKGKTFIAIPGAVATWHLTLSLDPGEPCPWHVRANPRL